MRARNWRRPLKYLALTLSAIALVLTLAVAALFHLDIPPLRDAVVERINAELASSLRGTVELTGVGKLRAGVVEDARVVVRDPRGREILRLEGVRASYDVGALLRSLLGGSDPIAVTIPRLEVRDGHVAIEEAPSGRLTLAEAFAPRHPSAKKGRYARVARRNKSVARHRRRGHGAARLSQFGAGALRARDRGHEARRASSARRIGGR
jgi:hypothetical protein